MAFLHGTPYLETATPFAMAPTMIETDASDVKKAMISGIGMAVGLAIGGYILLQLTGKKVM